MGNFERGGFGRGPPREQREMHDAVCAECGEACQVPFKPAQDRPVYCRNCFQSKRQH